MTCRLETVRLVNVLVYHLRYSIPQSLPSALRLPPVVMLFACLYAVMML
jgi:hypothetical protein